jgi:hypothetical protein
MIETERNGDHGKTNDVDHGWRKVQHKKTPTSLARERKTTGTAINENEGEGRTLSQVGFIDF